MVTRIPASQKKGEPTLPTTNVGEEEEEEEESRFDDDGDGDDGVAEEVDDLVSEG